jgi:hypothetical protein
MGGDAEEEEGRGWEKGISKRKRVVIQTTANEENLSNYSCCYTMNLSSQSVAECAEDAILFPVRINASALRSTENIIYFHLFLTPRQLEININYHPTNRTRVNSSAAQDEEGREMRLIKAIHR